MSLSFNDIKKAHNRIKNHVVKTPLLTNQIINKKFGADIYFKCENFQNTGSFKFRGVMNKMLKFKEDNGFFPEKIVAVSSGNHAHAVAYVAQKFGVKALIFMEKKVSPYKVASTKSYGAEVVLTNTKKETEIFAEEKIKEGYVYFHSSNDVDIVCGQGTSPLEAIEEAKEFNVEFDAIFAPCGGGGLVTSSYLAGQIQENKPKVYAVEPAIANDTAITYRTGKVHVFEDSPNSIADGARTLKISDHNIPYLFKLDGVYEIEEENIIKWTQIVSSRLRILIEPTGALGMGAAEKFLKEYKGEKRPKLLVILSGGNMSQETARQVWEKDYLMSLMN
jgi:threonine dehydratase